MKALFITVKVLFGLLMLACLSGAIYLAVAQPIDDPAKLWVTFAALLGLTVILGVMAVKDIIAWVKARK